MTQGTISLAKSLYATSTIASPSALLKNPKSFKTSLSIYPLQPRNLCFRQATPLCCTKLSKWEPSTAPYAPAEEISGEFLENTPNIFESLGSKNPEEAAISESEELQNTPRQSVVQFQLFKWPVWLLGPALLLGTGMAPTLWLPLSSVFVGSNVVSLLSIIGLDCIFNLGATLFLLIADSCARPKNPSQPCKSKPPFSYRFWNILATSLGFIAPSLLLLGSRRGLPLLQPQLPFLSSAILLGPYMILLSVQTLTEMLTWHWQSPVWLVTPLVYESYRVLQLMRGLRLGAELGSPAWTLHMLRGLVSWWVLILGVQLMRVAWFAGFTARARRQNSLDSS